MKKTILLSNLILLCLSLLISAKFYLNRNMQDYSNNLDEKFIPLNENDQRVSYLSGAITFKLKANKGDYSQIKDKIVTGISSLDEKFRQYEVNMLDKRFTYRSENLKEGRPDLSRIYKISFPEKYDVMQVVRSFREDPNVEYAEPIFRCQKQEVPNDEQYNDMYHLPLIQAEDAWDIHKGENGPEIIIGIVDDAVDWRHQDLVGNQWENLGEDVDGDGHVFEFNGSEWIFDPGDENGIDDDGNGKIDDFVGWDFINENDEQDNDPSPSHPGDDHGTHCIGIANSRTNNVHNIASIPWNVKFVSASTCNDGDLYLDYDGYEAMIYIAELGVDVITNSWSSGGFSQADMEAIEYVQSLGAIVVAAAGNDNNNELNYPASYPGVISVAASTAYDYKASFSSYGIGVDICAPGSNILSLKPDNSTQYKSGTSMATPLMAGLFALIKSYYSNWSNEDIIIQAMATADDIDWNNQSYANELGYGRINAYRALTETNVATQQEIRLLHKGSNFTDADTNGIFSPGDILFMDIEFMNFSIGLDTATVTFSLSSSDPDITMLIDELSCNVPSDQIFSIDSAFSIQISPDLDSTKLITLVISASSDLDIPLDSTWESEVLVNQKGIFVYNGPGSGNAYSGEFIRDFLIAQGLDVFYSEAFPSALMGFDAVFLSYGNYGASLSNGTYVTPQMTYAIADYLYDGGYLYEDCGSFFGLMEYYEYQNLEEMFELFSIDTVETPLTANSIDTLMGMPGSLGEGMEFYHSTQYPNYYIDIMLPDSNGMGMFEENEYGIVAVQGEGDYGQRTVCFSYSIAHLEDNSSANKELLLARIAEFFDLLNVGIEEPGTDLSIEMNIYPNPASHMIHITIDGNQDSQASISISDLQGKSLLYRELDKYVNHINLDISSYPPGLYMITYRSEGRMISKKLIKM